MIAIFGLTPIPFHLLNIFAHIISSLFVWKIADKLVSRRVGVIAAFFFALHPVAIESVQWISGGVYGLYSMLCLISFSLFIRHESFKSSRKMYSVSIFIYMLALLVSEKAIPFIFILFSYCWWKKMSLVTLVKQTLPYFFLSCAFGAFWLTRLPLRQTGLATMSYSSYGGYYNPLTQIPTAIGTYLELFIAPIRLSFYHSDLSLGLMVFTLQAIVTVLFLGTMIWGLLKRNAIGFWLSIILIPLLLSLTPIKIAWVVAERYAYLSLFGVVVCIAIVFDAFIKRSKTSIVGWLLVYFFLFGFLGRTLIRLADWRNANTLWTATSKTAPGHYVTWNNMGDVYARRGDLQQAVASFKRAIALHPTYADAYHNLGYTYLQMGKFVEAKETYTKALSLNKNLWQSHRDLAIIAAIEKDFVTAEREIGSAISLAPLEPSLPILQKKIEDAKAGMLMED